MCDTLCCLPDWSAVSSTLLAKNSDRSPNEPHIIRFVPAKHYTKNERVQCTYIDIPQAERTNAVLLLKPSWIWGAEMGVNEHGVAIGNEAVFTKAKRGEDALIGMDLLRLALERADSAVNALDVLTQLMDQYGQGGNCGYQKEFYYDNSFLIADKQSAYILETSGKNYAAVELSKYGAISNRLSIEGEHTLRNGVLENESFAKKYKEPVFTLFARGKERRSQSLCALADEPMTVTKMMGALRTHAPNIQGHEFERGNVGSVCMHAGGRIGDHTTGSFVAVLRKDAPMTIWATGASTPCIAAFKPIFFGIDSGAPVFESEVEGKQYWYKREKLHRAVIAGQINVEALRAKRDTLEASWIKEEARLFDKRVPDVDELKAFAMHAAAEEEAMIEEFSRKDWAELTGRKFYMRYWRKKNVALKADFGEVK